MAEFYSVKAPNFLSELYIFILRLLNIRGIFKAKDDRTIKFFKVLLKEICLKLILVSLEL